jgi:hypothetical protein
MPSTDVTLTVLAGYPGVGKSFVGREIAALENAVMYSTDRIRKELTDGDPTYSSDESAATYNEMYSRARNTLQDGTSVILDATFNLQEGRARAETIADDRNVTYRLINVVCDDETTKQRIRSRDNISDADVAVYQGIKAGFDEFERDVITIDNSGEKTATQAQLVELQS